MKTGNKTVLFLYGLCAVIWSVRAVQEIVHKTYEESLFWFCLNLLVAVLWIWVFFVTLRRVRKDEAEAGK